MIVTDSMGSARKSDKITISYDKTYPYLINNFFMKEYSYNHFIFTQGYLTSKELFRLVNNKLDLYDKKYIIFHVGLVDCTRRMLSRKGKYILPYVPFIGSLLKLFSNKYHYQLTRMYNITYVDENNFLNYLSKVIMCFNDSKIYFLPILPVTDVLKKKSYNIDNQINDYNDILTKISSNNKNVFLVDNLFNAFQNKLSTCVLEDGYHPNIYGHRIIANQVISYLKNQNHLD